MANQNGEESSIYNGAECGSYTWCQTLTDLEINVQLSNEINPDQLNVSINRFGLSVTHIDCLIVSGAFERSIREDSFYWSLESHEDRKSLVIYLNKSEAAWWSQLLVDEIHLKEGKQSRVASIDDLDDETKMKIDKLLVDSRKRMRSKKRES